MDKRRFQRVLVHGEHIARKFNHYSYGKRIYPNKTVYANAKGLTGSIRFGGRDVPVKKVSKPDCDWETI